MKVSCDVILDLIPLVKDGVASDDSTQLVHDHVSTCENCKAELELFEPTNLDQTPSLKDEKIIFSIKRSIFITQLTILTVGAVIGIALTKSMGMFYNFIIMPVIGAVAVLAFKEKSYWAPLTIFFLSYLWQAITGIALGGFHWMALYSGLFYSGIYAALVGLGMVIAMLLKFAFTKEG